MCGNCGRDTSFEYSAICGSCCAEYCEDCLKAEEAAGRYSADADYVGDPPRFADNSSFEQCGKCVEPFEL